MCFSTHIHDAYIICHYTVNFYTVVENPSEIRNKKADAVILSLDYPALLVKIS
jgi:hypothetical protein